MRIIIAAHTACQPPCAQPIHSSLTRGCGPALRRRNHGVKQAAEAAPATDEAATRGAGASATSLAHICVCAARARGRRARRIFARLWRLVGVHFADVPAGQARIAADVRGPEAAGSRAHAARRRHRALVPRRAAAAAAKGSVRAGCRQLAASARVGVPPRPAHGARRRAALPRTHPRHFSRTQACPWACATARLTFTFTR